MMSLDCINDAAIAYHVPTRLIIAVLETEHGKLGTVTKNKNGTYDIGLMAINSSWLPALEKHGITQQDIQFDACVNIKVGTFILSKKIAGRSDLAIGIGDYNSHNRQLNTIYYQKVAVNLTKINLLLNL
jgi:hypothetical protein